MFGESQHSQSGADETHHQVTATDAGFARWVLLCPSLFGKMFPTRILDAFSGLSQGRLMTQAASSFCKVLESNLSWPTWPQEGEGDVAGDGPGVVQPGVGRRQGSLMTSEASGDKQILCRLPESICCSVGNTSAVCLCAAEVPHRQAAQTLSKRLLAKAQELGTLRHRCSYSSCPPLSFSIHQSQSVK